ncbi:MAG: DUF2029 domain-containing protein [Actinobacteria bacterium]|nr:DUF2029 domain-containing protein [Actinomycetota bacterium]
MKTGSFFRKAGCFFATKEIFENRVLSIRFYKYFLTGIFIRVLLLPFFFQRDILSTYQRAAETVFAGNLAADFQQFAMHLIHSAALFIFKFLIPDTGRLSAILLNENTWTSWIDFNNFEFVYRTLFLFKFPYLLIDIACMFLIIRLVYDGDAEKRLKVFKYWVLNPLVIFVTYVFARHDIVAVFFILLALVLAKHNRKYWSIAVLAVGVIMRFFPIMILPFLIFFLAKKKKDYVILFALGTAGLALLEAFSYFYFGRSVIFSLLNTQHFDYILSARLDLIIHDAIFIFIVAYMLLLFSFIHQKNKTFELFLNYCGMVYLLYVATSYFHPQYLLYAIPFLVIIFVRRNSVYYYHLIQFGLLMIVLIYWGDLVTKFLFASFDVEYILYMPGPIAVVNRFYNAAKFVNIFRSVFSAVSLWMIYLIYRVNRQLNTGSNLIDEK